MKRVPIFVFSIFSFSISLAQNSAAELYVNATADAFQSASSIRGAKQSSEHGIGMSYTVKEGEIPSIVAQSFKARFGKESYGPKWAHIGSYKDSTHFYQVTWRAARTPYIASSAIFYNSGRFYYVVRLGEGPFAQGKGTHGIVKNAIDAKFRISKEVKLILKTKFPGFKNEGQYVLELEQGDSYVKFHLFKKIKKSRAGRDIYFNSKGEEISSKDLPIRF